MPLCGMGIYYYSETKIRGLKLLNFSPDVWVHGVHGNMCSKTSLSVNTHVRNLDRRK
jgi:hypothetical protein